MQFDSGASFTVISAFALSYNEYEIKYLEQKLVSSKYISKSFGAASGEDFITYLCCADNVVFGNLKFKRFYYYMSLINKNLALLGDEFIFYSGVVHSPRGSFYINSFDYDGYVSNLKTFVGIDNVMNIMDIDKICSALISERSFNIMTNKEKVTNIWDLPMKYKPCRKKQYDAYVCMPPKGTIVIDKFVQHTAYRMMNSQVLFTVEKCSKNTMISQRLRQLMSQGQVGVVTEQEPFVVAGASGEFYTCSAQSLQKKFYFLVNNQPVQINEHTLVQRMKNGVLDWNVVRFIPNSAELLMACHVPTAYKGQIQTWMGIMTINDPSLQHGRGDFVVAKVDAMGVPSNTMRFVVNGTVFADTYDIRGWDDCVGSGSKARININTLPRII